MKKLLSGVLLALAANLAMATVSGEAPSSQGAALSKKMQSEYCENATSAGTNLSPMPILLADAGQCFGACAAEQGMCIGQCQGDGLCISNCAAAHGRCVARCR